MLAGKRNVGAECHQEDRGEAATVNEAISARKKFIAPVMVPNCARATAFCIDTTLIGNAVPNPNAKIDSNTSSPRAALW